MRIAVVGVGPRGLSVLERVASHAQLPGPPVELLLVEPGSLGSGTHSPSHPEYVLLNTIASQLTIFSDEWMTPGAPVTTGPSFHQWCLSQGIEARFDDYLPRRLLGDYLQWAAGELLRRAPERLTVRRLATVATDVRPSASGVTVTCADGTRHQVDLAITTTGHGLAEPDPGQSRPRLVDAMVSTAYPLPDAVAEIPAGVTVAVQGTGLTAMDVIAALTVGRGGVFAGDTYHPSGQEPRIVLTNRNGWLPCARPATRSDRVPAPAQYLTSAALAALRKSTVDGRLDFQRDVEPLIHCEVLGRMHGATPAEFETAQAVLSLTQRHFASYPAYVAAVLRRARRDLVEARRGLGESLVKEGLEVLRDHREALRLALDAPGLNVLSHQYFMTEYVPVVNRAVIGPQKERISELLALITAGVVDLGPGPRPELARKGSGWVLSSTGLARRHEMTIEVLVKANLSWPTSDPAVDPVIDSLRGWATPGQGGAPYLRLDRDGFLVPLPGVDAARCVAVFGPPAEGASYYNHYVPSPGVWSRALTDLDRVIRPTLAARPRDEAAVDITNERVS